MQYYMVYEMPMFNSVLELTQNGSIIDPSEPEKAKNAYIRENKEGSKVH